MQLYQLVLEHRNDDTEKPASGLLNVDITNLSSEP